MPGFAGRIAVTAFKVGFTGVFMGGMLYPIDKRFQHFLSKGLNQGVDIGGQTATAGNAAGAKSVHLGLSALRQNMSASLIKTWVIKTGKAAEGMFRQPAEPDFLNITEKRNLEKPENPESEFRQQAGAAAGYVAANGLSENTEPEYMQPAAAAVGYLTIGLFNAFATKRSCDVSVWKREARNTNGAFEIPSAKGKGWKAHWRLYVGGLPLHAAQKVTGVCVFGMKDYAHGWFQANGVPSHQAELYSMVVTSAAFYPVGNFFYNGYLYGRVYEICPKTLAQRTTTWQAMKHVANTAPLLGVGRSVAYGFVAFGLMDCAEELLKYFDPWLENTVAPAADAAADKGVAFLQSRGFFGSSKPAFPRPQAENEEKTVTPEIPVSPAQAPGGTGRNGP